MSLLRRNGKSTTKTRRRIFRNGSASAEGGEFVRFRSDVLVPGYRFPLYTNVSEDAASSSAVTWPTAKGPYVAGKDLPDEWYLRTDASTDAVGAELSLQAIKTSAIT